VLGQHLMVSAPSTPTRNALQSLAAEAEKAGGFRRASPLLYRRRRHLGYIASVLVKTTELSDHEIRLRAVEEIICSLKSRGVHE
jgi:hypothetical protein